MSQFTDSIRNLDLDTLQESIRNKFYDPLKQKYRPYRGLDGITFNRYMKNPRLMLETVKRQILCPSKHLDESGQPRTPSRFTFSPFEQFQVPKKVGSTETRPLSKASISSIIAQRMLANFMTPILDSQFIPESYAYRPKKSAKQAIRATQKALLEGYNWVLDADIRKYFDRVDHDILLEKVRNAFPEEYELHYLLYRFLKTGFVDITRLKKGKKLPRKIRSPKKNPDDKEEIGYSSRPLGIPQGGILSGLLANLYLHEFDCILKQCFPDIVYIRYADDFLVFSRSEEQIKLIARYIRFILRAGLKLELHPWKDKNDKSQIREIGLQMEGKAEPYVDFLGYRVCREKVKIQPKNMKAFKLKLSGVISEWKKTKQGVGKLIRRVNRKLKGRMYELGMYNSSCFIGKNWTAYFSLVTHHGQLKELDDWLDTQLVKAIRQVRAPKYTRRYLKNARPALIKLVRLHYKMRREEAQKLKQLKAMNPLRLVLQYS